MSPDDKSTPGSARPASTPSPLSCWPSAPSPLASSLRSFSSRRTFSRRVSELEGVDGGSPDGSSTCPTPSTRLQRCESNDSLDGLMFQKYHQSPAGVLSELWREAVEVAKLASKLLGYLGIGWKWVVALLQLILFSMLLMPGFLQMVVFYLFSGRICRSVRYGDKPRNCLDVYVPRYRWLTEQGPRPGGGAWTIGYKGWGALVGRRLSQSGAVVFCLDYRNFPQGNAVDMVEDVNTGIAWVLEMCQYYGGDPARVHLVGQSAGAQLAGLAIIRQAIRECSGNVGIGCEPTWSPTAIKGFVGVSGAYDLLDLHTHFHKRGMYENLIQAIFTIDGRVSYGMLSPTHAVRDMQPCDWAVMPPILLLHGSCDKTVPPEIAEDFLAAIQASGGYADLRIFTGMTHTSPIVEDPLLGKDLTADHILTMINGEETCLSVFPMVPKFLAAAASYVCPF
eukprot:jgi/Tetstr1/422606/TSEL_013412.t1